MFCFMGVLKCLVFCGKCCGSGPCELKTLDQLKRE